MRRLGLFPAAPGRQRALAEAPVAKIYESILEAVGNTPMVRLRNV